MTEPSQNSDDSPNTPAGLEFPCAYPVKAMGKADEKFHQTVIDVVAQFASVDATQVRSKNSKAGNYRSITVTIHVESRTQLEQIYQALRAHRDVLWTL